MKFSIVWRWFVLLGCMSLVSFDTLGQGLPEVQLSVAFRGEPLRNVLNYLERETGVKFVYSASHLDLDEEVTVNISYASLQTILDALLSPRGIRYIPQDGTPFVVLVSAPVETPTSAQIVVKGQVLSAGDNVPLSSVSVVIRGTTRGAITDINGKYVLEAGANDVLVFTYIGFERFEIPVGSQSTINVTLKEDISSLSEVMVNAGYWQIPQREQTGNIAKVNSEQISAQPVANILQTLQGNVPGLYVQQATGVPGGYYSVEIRGRNSIRADGNLPLYIVDGVPYTATSYQSIYTPGANIQNNPLNAINPNDIESIEVLKDADATAIYGTRGGNGVILITTRRGRKGPTQVTMNVYSGIGQVPRQLELLNTKQWLEMRHEAFRNDKITPNKNNAPDLLVWDTTRYTDWQKELIGGTSGITNGQVSIDGGDEHTQFNLSTSFRRQNTVFPGDFEYKRASAHFNLDHSSADKKFRISFNTEFVGEENDMPQSDPTALANTLLPIAPPAFDSLGQFSWVTGSNPFALLTRTYGSKTRTLITNVTLNYSPLRNLQCRLNMGYTMYRGRDIGREPMVSYNPNQLPSGRSRLAVTGADGWVVEPIAEYTRHVAGGKLSVLAGFTMLENLTRLDAFIGEGYTSDALLANLNAAPSVEADQTDVFFYRYMAAFGRVNYAWRDKYFVNLTGRTDGSSRFGPNREFAKFGAIGISWLFSSEDFMSSLPLSFGKIRTSYGLTGSDQIGDYYFASTFIPTVGYDGGEAIVPTRLTNPDYGWESNRKFEVAAELGFSQNRIHLMACWYNNRSGSQLVGYPLPTLAGEPSVQANFNATVENKGWEFSVRTVNIHSNKFSWTTSGNLTIPRNRLISYPNLAGSTYAQLLEVGKSLYLTRRYHGLGVDAKTGIYKTEDVDGDGFFGLADIQSRIELTKRYYGAISNTFQYKGWSLDFMFQYVRQPGLGMLSAFSTAPGVRTSNQPDEVMERWQKPGDNSSIQRFTTTTASPAGLQFFNYRDSDARYTDASFIRLRNVSLSWELPSAWINRMRLKRAQLYAQGQNVLLFTRNKMRDPDMQSVQNLPPLRIFTFGVIVSL